MGNRVWYVSDKRRGLSVHLATLQTEASVYAVRAVAERTVGDPDRSYPHLDPQLERSGPGQLGSAGHGMSRVRVAMGVTPRPVVAGDGKL